MAVKKSVKKPGRKKEPEQMKKLRKILKKRGWPKDEIKEALNELWPPEDRE